MQMIFPASMEDAAKMKMIFSASMEQARPIEVDGIHGYTQKKMIFHFPASMMENAK